MKFVKSIFGRPDDDAARSTSSGTVESGAWSQLEDDAARERELAREFDANLTDFQRRQLEMAAIAPAPEVASQVDRRGTWYVADAIEVPADNGEIVDLAERTALEYVRQLEAPAGAGSTSSHQLRTTNGRLVTIESDPDADWPAILVRASDLERGES